MATRGNKMKVLMYSVITDSDSMWYRELPNNTKETSSRVFDVPDVASSRATLELICDVLNKEFQSYNNMKELKDIDFWKIRGESIYFDFTHYYALREYIFSIRYIVRSIIENPDKLSELLELDKLYCKECAEDASD